MKNQHAGRLDIASDQEPNSRSYVATAGSSLDKGIRSLPALMQARGMRYSSQNDVQQFVEQASSKEIDVDLNGTFVIPNIPVYYVQQNDETDDDVVLCKAVVPFRLYKSKSLDRETHVGLSGAATMVSVCRANLADAWFLTRDNQLQRCSSRTEVAVIRQNNGYIYVPEAIHSAILCCGKYDTATAKALKGLPFNAFDHRSATPSGEFRAKIVIQRLDYCHVLQWQESWGFYQLRALEKNDWDSDYLMNWNFSGAFTGLVPDYFHPSDSDNPQLPCARLFAFELIGPNKQIIASFRQPAVD